MGGYDAERETDALPSNVTCTLASLTVARQSPSADLPTTLLPPHLPPLGASAAHVVPRLQLPVFVLAFSFLLLRCLLSAF